MKFILLFLLFISCLQPSPNRFLNYDLEKLDIHNCSGKITIKQVGTHSIHEAKVNGKLHCEEHPAKIVYWKHDGSDMKLNKIFWYQNGKLHRENGVAAWYTEIPLVRSEGGSCYLGGNILPCQRMKDYL